MNTLRSITPTSASATIGEAWTLAWWVLDTDGNPTNAETPTVTITKPDGSTAALSATYTAQSFWTVQYTTLAGGRHLVHIATAGDAFDAGLYVDMVLTESGMPTPADASAYLGARAGSWTMAQITDAYNSERSAQRAKCGEKPVYPADLRNALFRRVSRNLAMQALPLAVPTGDADGGPAILPGNDPEVRRLEGPYRRLTTG